MKYKKGDVVLGINPYSLVTEKFRVQSAFQAGHRQYYRCVHEDLIGTRESAPMLLEQKDIIRRHSKKGVKDEENES